MRVKAPPVRRAQWGSGGRRRQRSTSAADSPSNWANPSGPPAPGGGASAKVYWPGGVTHQWCADADAPTWTTDDWVKMLTPDLDSAGLDAGALKRFVEHAEHYTEVVSSAVTGLSPDDYVVLANDRGELHYADWLVAGLDVEACPWRPNADCWGVHGPVIVMPRGSYP
jgi:hypothetical protein